MCRLVSSLANEPRLAVCEVSAARRRQLKLAS